MNSPLENMWATSAQCKAFMRYSGRKHNLLTVQHVQAMSRIAAATMINVMLYSRSKIVAGKTQVQMVNTHMHIADKKRRGSAAEPSGCSAKLHLTHPHLRFQWEARSQQWKTPRTTLKSPWTSRTCCPELELQPVRSIPIQDRARSVRSRRAAHSGNQTSPAPCQ